jgi:arylsulfatase A-like enzyme
MSLKPNILVVTIDCLRPDHLGIYGYDRSTSPFLDSFAEKGVIFENAFTTGPNTPPSFNSLFTSTYPFSGDGYQPLPRTKSSVIEILDREGYWTMGLNSNDYLTRKFNFHRGFSEFKNEFREQGKLERRINSWINYMIFKEWNRIADATIFLRDTIIVRDLRPYLPAEKIVEHLFDGFDDSRRPWLIWLHLMDAHQPYYPHNKELKELGLPPVGRMELSRLNKIMNNRAPTHTDRSANRIIELYDSNIRYMDRYLEMMIKEFEERSKDDLVVMIMADHGEEFFEHGHFGHFGKLYDELLRIPMIIKGVDKASDKRIKTPVSNIDIAPTILSLAGIDVESSMRGIDLIPVIQNGDGPKREIFSEVEMKSPKVFGDMAGTKIVSIRTDSHKLIMSVDESIKELYSMNKDPLEQNNIALTQKDITDDLSTKLKEHLLHQQEGKKKGEISKLKGAIGKLRM